MRGVWLSLVLLSGCVAQPRATALRTPLLDENQLRAACAGDFDSPPAMLTGEFPIYPASMLYRAVIDDRKTRHLPLVWDVESKFSIDENGAVRDVRSSSTEPQSFSNHTTLAIREWRFRPASRQAQPLATHCTVTIAFDLSDFPGTL